MSLRGCSHLDEVRSALSQGHWPEACAVDLRAHVDACSRCAEEILLTRHFQLARTEAVETARPGRKFRHGFWFLGNLPLGSIDLKLKGW